MPKLPQPIKIAHLLLQFFAALDVVLLVSLLTWEAHFASLLPISLTEKWWWGAFFLHLLVVLLPFSIYWHVQVSRLTIWVTALLLPLRLFCLKFSFLFVVSTLIRFFPTLTTTTKFHMIVGVFVMEIMRFFISLWCHKKIFKK